MGYFVKLWYTYLLNTFYTRAFEERRVYFNRVNVSTYVCSPQHLNIMALFLGLHTSYLYQVVRNCLRNIIASEKFFKIFNSFWDICHVLIFWLRKKMGAKIDFFFLRTLILNLDTIKLYQIVRNYLRNIIASEKFFKIIDSFWDICHVLIFWLRKNLGSKIWFFFLRALILNLDTIKL